MGRLASFSDALQLDSEELSSIPTGPASEVAAGDDAGKTVGEASATTDDFSDNTGEEPQSAADQAPDVGEAPADEPAPSPNLGETNIEAEETAPDPGPADAEEDADPGSSTGAGDPVQPPPAAAPSGDSKATKMPARKKQAPQTTPAVKPAATKRAPAREAEPDAPAASDRARWTQLQRKEFRMHNVQADSLATLTRKVNRMSPRDPEERVTDNTLIRVGLALLLELHKDDLRGKNERELRESVGLPPELPEEE